MKKRFFSVLFSMVASTNTSMNISIVAAIIGLSTSAFATPLPSGAPSVRMETTNLPESAPLNNANRTFRQLERYFDDHTQSQRLSYRIHRVATESIAEPMVISIRRLLLNISGGTAPGETSVNIQSLNAASDLPARRSQLASFLQGVTNVISTTGQAPTLSLIPLNKFEHALNALLAREDLRIFTAVVLEEGFQSQILLLEDEETAELLLLFVTRPPNEI